MLKNKFPRFRVLTVTTTPARVQHLIEAHQSFNHGKGSGAFLFTHKDAFADHTNALDLPWLNGRGEFVTLTE